LGIGPNPQSPIPNPQSPIIYNKFKTSSIIITYTNYIIVNIITDL